MILVDTSVWIEFLNSKSDRAGDALERFLQRDPPHDDAVAVTGIVVTELLQGLRRGVAAVTLRLSACIWLEPNGLATYAAAATIVRLARGQGVACGSQDAIIAAIAIEHRARLLTLDQDFERLRFTGLELQPF